MKSESRMFNLLAGFLFVAAAVYWFWTYYGLPGRHGEWIWC